MSGSLFQILSNNFNSSIVSFKNSDITYFKLVYHKYINFTIEQNIHSFQTNPELNEKPVYIKLDKYGDYLNKIILKLKIKAESTNSGNFSYIYNLGFSIIKNIQLKIGNTIIDDIFGIG